MEEIRIVDAQGNAREAELAPEGSFVSLYKSAPGESKVETHLASGEVASTTVAAHSRGEAPERMQAPAAP